MRTFERQWAELDRRALLHGAHAKRRTQLFLAQQCDPARAATGRTPRSYSAVEIAARATEQTARARARRSAPRLSPCRRNADCAGKSSSSRSRRTVRRNAAQPRRDAEAERLERASTEPVLAKRSQRAASLPTERSRSAGDARAGERSGAVGNGLACMGAPAASRASTCRAHPLPASGQSRIAGLGSVS